MALVCFDIDLDDDVEVYEENLIAFNEFENCEIDIPDDINISDLSCIKDEEGSVVCSAVVEQVVPLFLCKVQ